MSPSFSVQSEPGVVWLVGAGPGDPGLLTVRGARLLEQADVVIYDALANPKLLSYCPRAQAIYVGKRAADHAMSQDAINALLIEQARAGKRVVRLKGGDPFVFGRGGEECEALAAAGIRFEVVPGITAAVAAAAYAGIPVTHRDLNTSFTLITGHAKEDPSPAATARAATDPAAAESIDWSAIAKLPCIAFYMGVSSLPRICNQLISHGMPAQTPAATIQNGTTPQQRTVVATLADLPQRVAEAGIRAPAITIVGRVVSLRQTLAWFETRPLFDQTIVVTRTRQQASELSEQLESLGASVIEAPTIQINPPDDWQDVDAALRSASKFDWIIFTSANGVTHTRQRLLEIGLDARAFGLARIAAVGESTADAVRRELCLRVDLSPAAFVADALADALESDGAIRGKRFLLLRADIARAVLTDRLARGGAAQVRDVSVYETRPADSLPQQLLDALDAGQVSWVTFTSSSTARKFATLLGADYRHRLAKTQLASIGPITSKALAELGLTVSLEATRSDVNGLLEAIRAAGEKAGR